MCVRFQLCCVCSFAQLLLQYIKCVLDICLIKAVLTAIFVGKLKSGREINVNLI